MAENCPICDKPLGLYKHNRQVYCSEACSDVAKATHNRVSQQKKVYDRMMKGAECARCKKVVHEVGMRKYCKECRRVVNGYKICTDCGEEHSRQKTDRCLKCAKKRALKQRTKHNANHNALKKGKNRQPCRWCGCKLGEDVPPQSRYCSDECKEASKPKKQPNSAPKNKKKADKPTINPKFLVRGNISNNSSGNSMDCGYTA